MFFNKIRMRKDVCKKLRKHPVLNYYACIIKNSKPDSVGVKRALHGQFENFVNK